MLTVVTPPQVSRSMNERYAGRQVRIYGLAHPLTGECRYVGMTAMRLNRRLSCHLCAGKRRRRTPCASWIYSLLENGLEPEIFELESVPAESREEVEEFWIRSLRFLGCRLLNLTYGGDGTPGLRMDPAVVADRGAKRRGEQRSAQHRAKLSAALKGRRPSSQCIEAHVAATRGKPIREDVKKRISESLKGRVVSKETREKLSRAATGRKLLPEAAKRLSESLRRSSLRRGRGVCPHNGGKWRALIFVNGKQLRIGTYATKEEALKARIAAEEKYWWPAA